MSNRSGQWQPWQMDDLDRPKPSEALALRQREHARQQSFQRDAELRALREQARQQAYEQGYAEGFNAAQAEGYAQGLAEGRQAGEAEMHAQTQAVLEPLVDIGSAFEQALRTLDEQLSNDLVEMALATAKHLVGEAFEAQPEHVLPLVRALLHDEPSLTGKPRLFLNPADLVLVKAHLGHELEAAGWQLQPDARLQRGGCRATSASGELDATRETRWAAVLGCLRKRKRAATDIPPEAEETAQ